MKRLIIFDCDGVLVDSEMLANQIFVDYLAEFKIQISMEEALREFKGAKMSDCIAYAQRTSGVALPEHFETEFRRKMASGFESSLKSVAGVESAIKELGNFTICVASNGPLEKTKKSLSITGLDKYFGDRVFSAHSIQKWKPEPDLFQHACSQLGFKPHDCLVVEDSIPGVRAAKAAKMKVLGYSPEKNHELDQEGITVLNQMNDLTNEIEKALKSFTK